MAFNIPQFRLDFPEFADPDPITGYSDSLITTWSNLAIKFCDQEKFGECYTLATELYTAHRLVLAKANQAETLSGGLPGGNGGSTSSKTVGSASITFDTISSAEKNAGQWNQTAYGRQFIALARMIGFALQII